MLYSCMLGFVGPYLVSKRMTLSGHFITKSVDVQHDCCALTFALTGMSCFIRSVFARLQRAVVWVKINSA